MVNKNVEYESSFYGAGFLDCLHKIFHCDACPGVVSKASHFSVG